MHYDTSAWINCTNICWKEARHNETCSMNPFILCLGVYIQIGKPRKWLSQTIWEWDKRAVRRKSHTWGLLETWQCYVWLPNHDLYRYLLCNFHQNVHICLNTSLYLLYIMIKNYKNKTKHLIPFCIKTIVYTKPIFCLWYQRIFYVSFQGVVFWACRMNSKVWAFITPK